MTSQIDKLNILYWNANGLTDKIHELHHFMDAHFIHIACIQETFLKPTIRLASNPDYFTYRLDRMTASKGGVAIIVHKTIPHALLSSLNQKYVETIGVAVKLSTGEWINIYSLYVPGTSDNASINNHLTNDITKITQTRRSFFACGDFNARHRDWNCVRANRAGTLLHDDMNRKNYFIDYPNEPTHVPVDQHKQPSTIDLILTNKLHDYSTPETTELASDHRAITFTINAQTDAHTATHLNHDYANADWEKFKAIIHRNINATILNPELIETTAQVDAHIEKLASLIHHAQNKSIPLKSRSSYKLDLPDSLISEIKIKNAIKRNWQRTRNPQLKSEVNLRERVIKHKIDQLKNENWAHKLSSIKKGDNRTWKTAKFLRKRNQVMPPLKIPSHTLLTKEEKSNAIADEFEANHRNPRETHDPQFTILVNERAREFLKRPPDDIPTRPTDTDEIEPLLSSLKNQKSPGPDKISNRLIKKLPKRGVVYIAFIINSCLKLNYFPATWKSASVIPVPKPNKCPSNPSSYRPISLLSAVSKLLERVILSRIQDHLEENKIIPDIQHGFRKNHSTTHQLHRVIQSARNGLVNKQSTGMITLDIEKAFDRIWHNGLIYKMIDLKFPSSIIRITNSFLSERTFVVNVNGANSTPRPIPAGVPQGAVLSPTLYNIYTHDIPQGSTYSTALFADDTAFYKSSHELRPIICHLQKAAGKIEEYFDKWKININNQKTSALFITKRKTREIPVGPIRIFNNDVAWDDHIRYLGVHIDTRMTFQHHIEQAVHKATVATKILYPLINRKSRLNTENKLQIYKLAIRPILTYGIPALKEIAQCHITKLQKAQSKCLKMILDKPWFESTSTVHRLANTPLIADHVAKLTNNFLSKLNQ